MRPPKWILAFLFCVSFGAKAQTVTIERTPPLAPTILPGEVVRGTIVSKVPPVYPAAARATKIEGTVVLHAIIGKDGYIKNLTYVSGPALLTPAALDAVKQWVYKPYLLYGEPTEVDTTIMVNFHLNKPLRPGTPADN